MSFSTPSRSGQQSEFDSDRGIYVAMGGYLNTVIKTDIKRSLIGDTSSLRSLGEGISFKVFRTTPFDDGGQQGTAIAVKLLRGVPSGQSATNYANKNEFRAVQIDSLRREVDVLCHSPLRNHDNILRILGWGFGFCDEAPEDSDDEWHHEMAPFITVELTELGSLKDLSLAHCSWETRRELCLDVALGMGALHACSISHGDLKLENILLFPHPVRHVLAKLSDFSHSFSPSPAAETSEYYGTERYCPPEIGSGQFKRLTILELIRCDIWAFGLAALEVLVGGDKLRQRLQAGHDTSSLLSGADGLSSSDRAVCEGVVQCCLNIVPEERGLSEDLRSVLDSTARSKPPIAVPVDHTVLGTIACQALPLSFDTKNRIYQRFHRSAFMPEDVLKFNMFQLAICHLIGFGICVCHPKSQLAFRMAASECDPTSTVAAIVDRLFTTTTQEIVTTDGQGWQNILRNVSNESYFSARIRAFQRHVVELTSNHQHSSLTSDFEAVHPLLLTCLVGNWQAPGSPDFLQVKDHHGRTVLHYACIGMQKHIVGRILDEGGGSKLKAAKDRDGCTPLHWLVMFSEEDIDHVGRLLVDPDNINATCSAQELPHHSVTLKGAPLHWAVLTRNKVAVRVLLQLGANVELCYNSRTALDLAVEFHLYDIVDVLLSHMASFDSGSGFGRKSMHLIAGNASIIQRRLIHGPDYKRAAALTVKTLDLYGCDINSRDNFLNTPLHRAVTSPFERGDLYVIKLLLANGADRNAQNSDGDCILHLAVKLAWCDRPNDEDIMRLLVDPNLVESDTSIDPNLQDNRGLTPLMLSAMHSLSGQVRLLVNLKGVDHLATDNKGNMVLDIFGSFQLGDVLDYIDTFIHGMQMKGLGALRG